MINIILQLELANERYNDITRIIIGIVAVVSEMFIYCWTVTSERKVRWDVRVVKVFLFI